MIPDRRSSAVAAGSEAQGTRPEVVGLGALEGVAGDVIDVVVQDLAADAGRRNLVQLAHSLPPAS